MSITYNAYVGPYVRCAITLVDTVKTRSACLNPQCSMHSRYSSSPFCNRCGGKVGEIAYATQEPSVNQWKLIEELSERLTNPTGDEYDRWMRANLTHLWLPNWRTPWRDGHLEEREDFALVPIIADQVTAEQAAFQEFFAAEIAALGVRYGAANVHMAWGIIQDYN